MSVDMKENVIQALDTETEEEYDKRNCDEGVKKCFHNYDGQDDKREQICRRCSCLKMNIEVNIKYDIYFDDYL
jgi:hypothetical protein